MRANFHDCTALDEAQCFPETPKGEWLRFSDRIMAIHALFPGKPYHNRQVESYGSM